MDSKVMSLKEEEVSLERFRERVKEEKLEIPLDDKHLLRFLRTRAFNIEGALTTVRRYLEWCKVYGERIRIPFSDCSKFVLENSLVNVLKRWDGQGRRIVYVKMAEAVKSDVNILPQGEMAIWYTMEELSYYEDVQRNGMVTIFDFKGAGLAKLAYHMTYFTVEETKQFFGLFQGGVPMKIKGVYAVNTPLLFVTFYHAVKYVMKKKSRSRIRLYSGGLSSIQKHLGSGCAPWLNDDFLVSDHIDRDYIKELFSKHESPEC